MDESGPQRSYYPVGETETSRKDRRPGSGSAVTERGTWRWVQSTLTKESGDNFQQEGPLNRALKDECTWQDKASKSI